ncbi:MAG: ankyrin repeat domain-containing protein, partial [Micropepsaceae bacterium]
MRRYARVLLVGVLLVAAAAALRFLPIVSHSGGEALPIRPQDWRENPIVPTYLGNYSDVKDQFTEHLLGPLAVRSSYTPDVAKPREVVGGLVVAPGVRFVSARDEAAARTILVDIEVLTDGSSQVVARGRSTSTSGPAPDAHMVHYLGWVFVPFKTFGRPRTALIKNVPVRLLIAQPLAVGRVAFDLPCSRMAIKRQRGASGGEWNPRPIFTHNTEIGGDGSVVFVGEGKLLIPGVHKARVESGAVRQLFSRAISADLLRIDMSPRAETRFGLESGEGGSIAFECDGRILTRMPTSTRMRGDRQSIDDDIRILSGVDRWTRGNDATFAHLAAQGSIITSPTFQNMKYVRAVAQYGTLAGILDMVRRGVPVSAEQQRDVSPEYRVPVLGIVASRGEGGIVGALLDEEIKWSNEEVTAAFRWLSLHDDSGALERLAAAGADARSAFLRDHTALMNAASSAYPRTIATVLKYDSRVNAQDEDGRTPMHHLALASRKPPDWRGDHAIAARLLVKRGANVNARDRYGSTPLFYALSDAKMTQILLQLGADPNIARGWDRPLTRPSSPEVARLLIAYGANVNATDKDGLTPLMLYGAHPDIV